MRFLSQVHKFKVASTLLGQPHLTLQRGCDASARRVERFGPPTDKACASYPTCCTRGTHKTLQALSDYGVK